MTRLKRLFLIAACVAIASTLPVSLQAQDTSATPITLGKQVSIYSEVLGEERPVMIYTPPGYELNNGDYPVMYLLDGDSHLLHTAGITDFLSRNGLMPQMVIVGIPNTERTRDLTPAQTTPNERFPTAGGADNFMAFIGDELMPFIEEKFRVAPYKILVGHSFGGLFSVHTLLTRPELFDAHIAISPSLWWDQKGLVPRADAFFDEQEELEAFMYMTLGNEGGAMLAGVWEMAGVFEEKAPEGFEWHFDRLEKETHGSVPHRSTYRALEALYDGWVLENPVQVFEKDGLAGLDAHFATLSKKFGYTIETPESMVNRMGYRLLGREKYEDAIAVFQRNVAHFPSSANVYDSLGDAYDASEKFSLAAESYEKACMMGQEQNHASAAIYCANWDRIKKKMADLE